jgi:hypothetical protein
MEKIEEEKEGEKTIEKKTDIESGNKLEDNKKETNLEWRYFMWKR